MNEHEYTPVTADEIVDILLQYEREDLRRMICAKSDYWRMTVYEHDNGALTLSINPEDV